MQTPIEFEVNGQQYRTYRLPAKKQFHILRRLGPIVIGAVESYAKVGGVTPDTELKNLAALLPILEVLGRMRDDELDYVVDTCLSSVHRAQGTQWAKVQAPNGTLMFEDIDTMEVMLPICVEVIKANLVNFSSESGLISNTA